MVKKAIWFITLIILMVLSYVREVLFRTLNAIIDGSQVFYAKTVEIEFFSNLSIAELINYKYFFTVLFSVVFIATTSLGLKYSHLKAKPHILALILYGLFILLAIILIAISFLLGKFESFYPYLRILIGLIHNPLVFILVSISSFSLQKVDNL